MARFRIRDKQGREYGPVDASELRSWIIDARLTADMLIQQEGLKDWIRAGDVPAIARLLAERATTIARGRATGASGGGSGTPPPDGGGTSTGPHSFPPDDDDAHFSVRPDDVEGAPPPAPASPELAGIHFNKGTDNRIIIKLPVIDTIAMVLIAVLVCVSGWLLYNVYYLKEDVKVLAVELAETGRIARHADSTSHRHDSSYSEVRLKVNVTCVANTLAQTLRLRPVTYEWNTEDFPYMGLGSGLQVGLIAQELERVFPELVSPDRLGYKRVDYSGLTVVLLKAIQEQQASIDVLRQQCSCVAEQVAELERALGTND